MSLIAPPQPIPSTQVPMDTWINASWEEFVQLSDDPTHNKTKGYYHNGAMRFEAMSTGSDHSDTYAITLFAIILYSTHNGLPLTTKDACSYRKTGQDEFQPDISCYSGENANAIPNGTRIINLDTHPLPNLVIEISDTTLSDDKGEKRLQYEELGISEYWIVSVQTCDIIAFSISNIGTSQRIQTSQVIPGLEFSLLKTTLQRRRESNQSAAMAWLMTQIQQ
jgi:Uma2 family endonuclease